MFCFDYGVVVQVYLFVDFCECVCIMGCDCIVFVWFDVQQYVVVYGD